jgi:hypothetical protein
MERSEAIREELPAVPEDALLCRTHKRERKE